MVHELAYWSSFSMVGCNSQTYCREGKALVLPQLIVPDFVDFPWKHCSPLGGEDRGGLGRK